MRQQLYRFSLLLLILLGICTAPVLAKDKVKAGNPAPAFSATGMDGQKLSLAALKGKIVVLNFWFVECSPCRKEMPELNALTGRYKDHKDVVFISLAMNTPDRLKTFFESNVFFYQTIPEAEAIVKNYRVNMFPTNLVIDKNGKIIYRKAGYSESTVQKLEKAIEKAVNQ